MKTELRRKVIHYVQLMTRGLLSDTEGYDSLLLWLGRQSDRRGVSEIMEALPTERRPAFERRWQAVESLGSNWRPLIIGEKVTEQEIESIQTNLRNLRLIEYS